MEIGGSVKQCALLEHVGLLLRRPALGSTEEQKGHLKQREVLPECDDMGDDRDLAK